MSESQLRLRVATVFACVALGAVLSGCAKHDATGIVDGTLIISSADAKLVAGDTFSIRGSGLADAHVSLDTVPLPIVLASDKLLRVLVTGAALAPCAGSAYVYPVNIRTPRAYVRIERPAAVQPLRVQLAPSAYVVASTALRRGCDIVFDTAGSYVAVPFRTDPHNQHIDTADVLLELVGPGVSAQVANGSRLEIASSTPLRWSVAQDAPHFVDVLLPNADKATSDATGACSLPLPGDSVPFRIPRSATGQVSFEAGARAVTEYWRLEGLGRRIALFIDTTTLRVLAADTTVASAVATMVAHYDTAIAPVLDRYFPPMPDRDGNGRLIVLMTTAFSFASGFAFPTTTMRADCAPAGEAIMVRVFPPVLATQTTLVRLVMAHESTHVIDLGSASPGPGGPAWISEGIATLGEVLYWNRASQAPLDDNLATMKDGNPCWSSFRTEPVVDGGVGGYGNYSAGCYRLAYLIEQAVHAGHGSIRDATTRLTNRGPDTSTFADVDAVVNGRERADVPLMAQWYLSWFADDRVSGVAPELENRTWNTPAEIARYHAINLGQFALPMPDTAIAGMGAVKARFGRPGAVFIELDAVSPGSHLRASMQSADSLDLAILRVH